MGKTLIIWLTIALHIRARSHTAWLVKVRAEMNPRFGNTLFEERSFGMHVVRSHGEWPGAVSAAVETEKRELGWAGGGSEDSYPRNQSMAGAPIQ